MKIFLERERNFAKNPGTNTANPWTNGTNANPDINSIRNIGVTRGHEWAYAPVHNFFYLLTYWICIKKITIFKLWINIFFKIFATPRRWILVAPLIRNLKLWQLYKKRNLRTDLKYKFNINKFNYLDSNILFF